MPNTSDQDKQQQWINTVSLAIEHEDLTPVSQLFNTLHASDCAHLIESTPPKERPQIWELLSADLRAEVLTHLNDEVRSILLEGMDHKELANAASQIEADDMADLLQDMSYSQTQQVLQSMDELNRQQVEEILSYPEDSAGGLMNTDVIEIRSDIDLDVVLRYLRMLGTLPEGTDTLMVVDRDKTFLGILPITTLLTQAPDSCVEEVMEKECDVISAEMEDTEVANLFESRDLISAPVLNMRGKLLGRITIDDVVDVIRDDADHSLLGRAGLDEEEDMFAPVGVSVRRRTVWLGINLATAFLASWVIGQFEATLQQIIALAVLMPIVASMGGIAGGQTLTLVIRGIALNQISESNTRWLIAKESAVGVLNGMLWAIVVGMISWLWFNDGKLGLVIAAAMTINLIIAALSGVVIPVLQKRMGIDPALAGYVVLTTVTDVVGFLSFLGLATLFLL
ncbi:MAG: magnesium transporter [Gammaproteobacteria bacterium]|jgi:magnesium transporter|nr:magnesium transporter [Gammaproteobacteria bacterium]MBT4606615.1 magnesium transporter [Thiotrichales bacterium]MBT3473424.1 magnesium transporter [Gammaproteobacteria bacterium]MBT4081231.1 magnesium transporter [Gammaproteobacteria bacterium]MBT4330080.1 magnesium transporter [Gammaproteobacteria bacterium]